MSGNKELDDLLIDSSSPDQSKEDIQRYLEEKQAAYDALEANAEPLERARLQLDVAEALVGMGRADESWEKARTALDTFVENEQWQDAVEACDVLYQSAQPASMVALAHGVWLAVTFPIEPDTTVAMLNHIIDETPDDSDGAAVAAMAAHYIADIRASDDRHDSLTFLTTNVLARVAKRHSQVNSQEEMQAWIQRLHLDKPEEFLPRLSTVIDVLVQDEWWFDRDSLRETLPVN